MVSELEYEAPTWNQIYDMLLDLADRIRKDGFEPDIIVGISRGGWPPARVLSDLLSNPNLANVRAEFYLGLAETRQEPTLTQPISVEVVGKRILIVDEVADTGKSLKLVREHILEQGAREVRTASMYYKPWSIVKPDYFGKETRKWPVFPWEIKETVRRVIKKCRRKGRTIDEETERLAKAGISKPLIRRFVKEISEEDDC